MAQKLGLRRRIDSSEHSCFGFLPLLTAERTRVYPIALINA